MNGRLALTHKLVQHVKTPFLELATVTMTNLETRFAGASFAGYLHGRNGALRSAYAGVFDPAIPQPVGEGLSEGPAAGSFPPPRASANPDVMERARAASVMAAKQIEYLIASGTTKESRTMYRGSDLKTQALAADAKLGEAGSAGVGFDYGSRAAWMIARDVRPDDAADVELQKGLSKLRRLGAPPIPKDVLPALSSRYSDEENEASRRDELLQARDALPPLEVEVQVANVGDCRAFGIVRKGGRIGGREVDDPLYRSESFELRYARDLGTQLPGWHGGETASLKGEAPSPPRAPSRPAAPDSVDEAARGGLTAEGYQLPVDLASKPGPIDPRHDQNALRSFNSQEDALRDRRSRLVPLSADQRPSRTEERLRIAHACGSIDMNRHALSITPPPIDPKTKRVDHSVRGETALRDETLVLPVARLLGFHRLKQDPELSAVEQIVSPLPDVKSWSMRVGDVFVMTTHALFETRSGEPTTVDSISELVLEGFLRRGIPTGAPSTVGDGVVIDIARDLCDFAVRFGASRNIAVTVMRCRECDALPASATSSPNHSHGYSRSQAVLTGPLYPGALRGSRRYREHVLAEAQRCGVTLVQLLMLRYKQTADLQRRLGTLASCAPLRDLVRRFPSEAGLLSAVMVDEADFFRDCPFAADDIDATNPSQQHLDYFAGLAKYVEAPSILNA